MAPDDDKTQTDRQQRIFSSGRPSIAVLPFSNLSADKEQEYFCDGMAEEIINALSMNSPNGLGHPGLVYGLVGHHGKACEGLSQLEEMSSSRFASPLYFALI